MKIDSLISTVESGGLTISECVQILKDSEGVPANSVWNVEGHPLQHSHSDSAGTGRRLEDDYHFRGPLPIEKELKGGPNVGMFKASIKIETDGSFTPKGNTFHSQFQDDSQAGMCLKLLLQSKGGVWALKLLQAAPRLSVMVSLGMPGGSEYFVREAQLVGVGTPTSNLVSKTDMESAKNFVWFQRKDLASVVAVLRSKDSPLGHLHVQTLYPTSDALGAGSGKVSVTAKDASDYSGPTEQMFL